MDLVLLSSNRGRLVRDGDGVCWYYSPSIVTHRCRVLPERPITMIHAAARLGIGLVDLCELLDGDVAAARVSEIRLRARADAARKVGP